MVGLPDSPRRPRRRPRGVTLMLGLVLAVAIAIVGVGLALMRSRTVTPLTTVNAAVPERDVAPGGMAFASRAPSKSNALLMYSMSKKSFMRELAMPSEIIASSFSATTVSGA
jgi:hypothetical protein